MLIHNNKLSCQCPTLIQVWSERFKCLIEPHNLWGGCRGHRSKKKTITNTMFHNVFLQCVPIIPSTIRHNIPHIKLENTLRSRRTFKTTISTWILSINDFILIQINLFIQFIICNLLIVVFINPFCSFLANLHTCLKCTMIDCFKDSLV